MSAKGHVIRLSFSPGNAILTRGKPPKSTRTQGGDTIADYMYLLLSDRSTFSQKNKWQDDEGRIYIIYPIAEIAEIPDKGSTIIKGRLTNWTQRDFWNGNGTASPHRTGYM